MNKLANKQSCFSLSRTFSIFIKEFKQIKRDRLTFMMMAMMPLIMLILFGYAINIDPRHLPTTVIANDTSDLVDSYLVGLQNTGYFDITHVTSSEAQAKTLMQNGDSMFTITIPADFTRKVIRGERPSILLEEDGTQGMAISASSAAAVQLTQSVLQPLLQGSLQYLQPISAPFSVITHMNYNPNNLSSYAIVPGLLGVVLVMTMVMITSLAITREIERGTMESLLATPCRPLEVIIGKILPYLIVGYLQIILILLLAVVLFSLPVRGSVLTLMICTLPFIFSQLALGVMFSTLAKNQLQAIQMSFFWFLPNVLLSGFMFPFDGMPIWAKCIGNVFPLTHFINIVRSLLLKGASWVELWPNIWPILVFALFVVIVSMRRYKQTVA